MRSSIYMCMSMKKRCEWEKEATCSTIWNIREKERERAKDISQRISCFLSLSHEDRKCVRRSNLIPLSLSPLVFFLCQRGEKRIKNARRTPQG